MAPRAKKLVPPTKLRRACLDWLGNFGRVDDATKRTVERGLLRAWKSGEPYMQYAALQFILSEERPPSASQAVLALALRSKHPSMVGNAQSAAFILGSRQHQEFEPPLVNALQHQVEHSVLGSERWFALEILNYSRKAQPWVAKFFQRTDAPELRLEAARILLRHGSALGKDVVLQTIRADSTGHLASHEVWARRDVLDLTPGELRDVKKAVVRYMGSHRRRLYAKASSNHARRSAADVLSALAAEGFALTPRDKKAIRRIKARRPVDEWDAD